MGNVPDVRLLRPNRARVRRCNRGWRPRPQVDRPRTRPHAGSALDQFAASFVRLVVPHPRDGGWGDPGGGTGSGGPFARDPSNMSPKNPVFNFRNTQPTPTTRQIGIVDANPFARSNKNNKLAGLRQPQRFDRVTLRATIRRNLPVVVAPANPIGRLLSTNLTKSTRPSLIGHSRAVHLELQLKDVAWGSGMLPTHSLRCPRFEAAASYDGFSNNRSKKA